MPISSKEFSVFLSGLQESTTLVAVSKTKPKEDISTVYSFGQLDFGENKVQELCEKHQELPKDIRWHMIGHLQRNKVKDIAPFVHLIHSVDSERLLKEINKQGEKLDKKINILLQVYIAEEDTKFGFDKEELQNLLTDSFEQKYPNVEVFGLMGMATFTEDVSKVAKEFRSLQSTFLETKERFSFMQKFDVLSMGMSGDYKIALENGSNMIRVGSMIFGNRNH